MTVRLRSALLLVSLVCLILPGSARAEETNPAASARADAPPAGASATNATPMPALQADAAPQRQAARKPPVYFEPTYLNLLRSMIRFKGYDIDNDDLLDSYTLIEGCDLYTKFYKDDFAWKQIRAMYRKSLAMKTDLLPEYFSFVVPVLLERYDFQSGIFRFAANSTMRNTHRLILADHPTSTCSTGWESVKRLPHEISVEVAPFTIEGLKIPRSARTVRVRFPPSAPFFSRCPIDPVSAVDD